MSLYSGETPPPPGVRHSLSALSSNAGRQLYEVNKSAEYMAEHQLAQELNKAENVAQKQKLCMVGTGEVCVKKGQISSAR